MIVLTNLGDDFLNQGMFSPDETHEFFGGIGIGGCVSGEAVQVEGDDMRDDLRGDDIGGFIIKLFFLFLFDLLLLLLLLHFFFNKLNLATLCRELCSFEFGVCVEKELLGVDIPKGFLVLLLLLEVWVCFLF